METYRRWIERNAHFHLACKRLRDHTGLDNHDDTLDVYGSAALVKLFELAFELAWRTLQDYLRYEDGSKPQTAALVIQAALDNGIITKLELWHDMLRDSSQKNYLYNPDGMRDVAKRIYNDYVFALNALDGELTKRAENI